MSPGYGSLLSGWPKDGAPGADIRRLITPMYKLTLEIVLISDTCLIWPQHTVCRDWGGCWDMFWYLNNKIFSKISFKIGQLITWFVCELCML